MLHHRYSEGCRGGPNCASHCCSHDTQCSCQKVRLRLHLQSECRQRSPPKSYYADANAGGDGAIADDATEGVGAILAATLNDTSSYVQVGHHAVTSKDYIIKKSTIESLTFAENDWRKRESSFCCACSKAAADVISSDWISLLFSCRLVCL